MTELWIGFGVVLLVMLVGMIGNLIPGVPGTSLIFVSALVHQLYFADAGGMGAGRGLLGSAFESKLRPDEHDSNSDVVVDLVGVR